MKTNRLLSVCFISILFAGCKKNETKKEEQNDTVIEETTIDIEQRASDIHFEKALKAYENGNKPEAVKQISTGIDALENEGKDISGTTKMKLDSARDQLRNIAGKLDENFDVSMEGFKEAIANAEINVAHAYLTTKDIYMITPAEKVRETNLHKALDQNLKSLNAGNSTLEGDAKKEGEKLLDEGQKLKEDFESWTKRAEEHAMKSEDHFKKYQDEYIYIW